MGPRLLSLPQTVVIAWSDRLDLPRPELPQGTSEPIGWRLVGVSNRELGRGLLLASPQAVAVATAALASRSAELRTQVVPAEQGTWVWHAALDGDLVAASQRAYRRRREAEVRARRFTEVLAEARLLVVGQAAAPGPVVTDGAPA